MKDDESVPTTTTLNVTKKESSDSSIFGKGRYKFWALAAILLLAFWSMFTGTVTLRWSAGNLNRLSDDLGSPIHDDLDVLPSDQITEFWQEAFEAAYEELSSDVAEVRDAAITEIAKMSVRSLVNIDSPPFHSTVSINFRY
ncbi:hypothetical protein CICLE_v10027139mg [Citrus x clementina]|uniref:Uncharacterized protein n=1 Tax=Citrus clementina TaxID=85681 RepID=V4SJB5_CITCL|nr:hypothetical protein CICLE_v10027139mg [Citrus x clementina]